jgi:hypothetical protein
MGAAAACRHMCSCPPRDSRPRQAVPPSRPDSGIHETPKARGPDNDFSCPSKLPIPQRYLSNLTHSFRPHNPLAIVRPLYFFPHRNGCLSMVCALLQEHSKEFRGLTDYLLRRLQQVCYQRLFDTLQDKTTPDICSSYPFSPSPRSYLASPEPLIYYPAIEPAVLQPLSFSLSCIDSVLLSQTESGGTCVPPYFPDVRQQRIASPLQLRL